MRFSALGTVAAVGAALLGAALTAAPAAATPAPTGFPVITVAPDHGTADAGYLIHGDITVVSAHWTEPTVTCAGDATDDIGLVLSIGYQGARDSNFFYGESVGAGDGCVRTDAFPNHHYTGAFDLVGSPKLPNGEAGYPVRISPGDAMSESVSRTSTSCTTTITDATIDWSVTQTSPILTNRGTVARVFYGVDSADSPSYTPVTVTDLEVNGVLVQPSAVQPRSTVEPTGISDRVGPLVNGSFTVTRSQS
jgi:hypothetical protein